MSREDHVLELRLLDVALDGPTPPTAEEHDAARSLSSNRALEQLVLNAMSWSEFTREEVDAMPPSMATALGVGGTRPQNFCQNPTLASRNLSEHGTAPEPAATRGTAPELAEALAPICPKPFRLKTAKLTLLGNRPKTLLFLIRCLKRFRARQMPSGMHLVLGCVTTDEKIPTPQGSSTCKIRANAARPGPQHARLKLRNKRSKLS